ncbi:MAG: carbohydrate ABC transporter permease, partial [Spirochaetaceae bacterium]|nr:carbohydrate ABC transporter permease [Spirochaetaceae bacterium]
RQYLVNYLTDDLIHAAMIDGASQMRIILQILIPLVKPAIILLVIKTGIEAWNEYLKPLVFLTDKSKMTVQIIISSSFGLGDHGAVLMAVYISLIPLLLLFLFASKQIIANITTGSIKY